jgi:hypothetical protein
LNSNTTQAIKGGRAPNTVTALIGNTLRAKGGEQGARGKEQGARSKEMRRGKNVGNIKIGFFPNSGRDELQNIPFFSFLKTLFSKFYL